MSHALQAELYSVASSVLRILMGSEDEDEDESPRTPLYDHRFETLAASCLKLNMELCQLCASKPVTGIIKTLPLPSLA